MSKAVLEVFGCAEPQSVRIQRDLTDRWRSQYEQQRYSFASTTVYHRRAPAAKMNQVPSRTRESGDYILDGVLECILGATSEDAIQVSLSRPHSRSIRVARTSDFVRSTKYLPRFAPIPDVRPGGRRSSG